MTGAPAAGCRGLRALCDPCTEVQGWVFWVVGCNMQGDMLNFFINSTVNLLSCFLFTFEQISIRRVVFLCFLLTPRVIIQSSICLTAGNNSRFSLPDIQYWRTLHQIPFWATHHCRDNGDGLLGHFQNLHCISKVSTGNLRRTRMPLVLLQSFDGPCQKPQF